MKRLNAREIYNVIKEMETHFYTNLEKYLDKGHIGQVVVLEHVEGTRIQESFHKNKNVAEDYVNSTDSNLTIKNCLCFDVKPRYREYKSVYIIKQK